MTLIEVIKRDITKVNVDIIVNAANTSLLGGGGVDGAIHKIGGKSILDECQKIRNKQGGCKTGEVAITSAGNLPAKFVIHTVGPVWTGGENNELTLLSKCYFNSLELAKRSYAKTISFPNISTGRYKFPLELAANIAIKTCENYLKTNLNSFETIYFVCFDELNYSLYKTVMNNHF